MQQASLCRWIKKFQFDFVLGKCVCSCGGEILQNPGEGGLPCCSQGHEVEDCNTELWPAAGAGAGAQLLQQQPLKSIFK